MCFGQDGTIDASYGTNGITKYSGAYGTSIEIDKKNNIVAGGYNYSERIIVTKYNLSGVLDNSFGTSGIANISFTTYNAVDVILHDIEIQADNKILGCGYLDNGTNRTDFLVFRLNENGSLDTTFNGTGVLLISFSNNKDVANSIKVLPSGKILIAGYSYVSTNYDYAIAKLNSDGTFDTSFSQDGKLTVDLYGEADYGNDIAFSNSNIFVAGQSYMNGTFAKFSVISLTNSGNLDTSFSFDGKQYVQFSPNANDECTKIFRQSDGKIILVGLSNSYGYAAARLLTNGNLDTTYNSNGKFTYSFISGASHYNYGSSALQTDNNLIIGGSFQTGNYSDVGLVKINSNGNLDPSFGNSGSSRTVVGNSPSFDDMTLQNDGKILLVGYLDSQNIGIVRFNNTSTSLSTNENNLSKNINLYIKDNELYLSENTQKIELFSANGSKISDFYTTNQINIAQLLHGKYFLIIHTDNNSSIVKKSFIK